MENTVTTPPTEALTYKATNKTAGSSGIGSLENERTSKKSKTRCMQLLSIMCLGLGSCGAYSTQVTGSVQAVSGTARQPSPTNGRDSGACLTFNPSKDWTRDVAGWQLI